MMCNILRAQTTAEILLYADRNGSLFAPIEMHCHEVSCSACVKSLLLFYLRKCSKTAVTRKVKYLIAVHGQLLFQDHIITLSYSTKAFSILLVGLSGALFADNCYQSIFCFVFSHHVDFYKRYSCFNHYKSTTLWSNHTHIHMPLEE